MLRATGAEVVIKVQHRGINELMRQDLINMERIVSWVAYAEPDFDFKPIINEWSKVAIDELDFKLEAANQKTIGANLARAKIDVKVPKITSLDGEDMVTSKVGCLFDGSSPARLVCSPSSACVFFFSWAVEEI